MDMTSFLFFPPTPTVTTKSPMILCSRTPLLSISYSRCCTTIRWRPSTGDLMSTHAEKYNIFTFSGF
jgi:hypothetical protein